jgi:hypothetical protein
MTNRRFELTIAVRFPAVVAMLCHVAGAQCPTKKATPVHAWAKGSAVHFTLDASWNNYAGGTGAVALGFASWNTADQGGNPSGVTFSSAAGGSYTVTTSTGTYPGHPEYCAYTIFPFNTAGNTTSFATTFYFGNSTCWNPSASGFATAVQKMMRHEIGHTQGLSDENAVENQPCSGQVAGQSAMNLSCGVNDADGNEPASVTNCDNQSVTGVSSSGGGTGSQGGGGTLCEPTNEPICDEGSPVCTQTGWGCTVGQGCYPPEPNPCCDECYEVCEGTGWECVGSPITIDAFGVGFHFTDTANGVKFRVLPSGRLRQMSWPDASFQNGWLALDRNGDGTITSFRELFGPNTPQPSSPDPNGYLALAVFDDPANGGNGNGMIDPGDSVYSHLLLWIDENHNGVSEPGELHGLAEMGIFSIDLKYSLSRYVDKNGNIFRYKANISDRVSAADPVCYDVFVTMK